MNVGFLGLGAMGQPMAANLAAAGHTVMGWNRSPLTPPEGVTPASTPAEVARACPAAVIMVTDAEAVRAVLFDADGWVAGAQPGGLVVQSSTIDPAATRRIAGELAARGLRLVDAPVSGSVGPAREGALTVLAGGEDGDLQSVQWVFEAIGKSIVRCGPVGTGSAVKLAVNAMLVAVVAAAGEALTWLVDHEPEVSLQELTSAFERVSPLVAKRADALVGEATTGGFTLRHVAKDLALITGVMAPAEVLESVGRAVARAVERDLQDCDVAALGTAARRWRSGDGGG